MSSQEAPYFPKRVAVSLSLMGVVVVGMVAALSQPALSTRSAPKQTTPAPVRVVDAPAAKESCAEQAWPYMEARCLTRDAKNAGTVDKYCIVSTGFANCAVIAPASRASVPYKRRYLNRLRRFGLSPCRLMLSRWREIPRIK